SFALDPEDSPADQSPTATRREEPVARVRARQVAPAEILGVAAHQQPVLGRHAAKEVVPLAAQRIAGHDLSDLDSAPRTPQAREPRDTPRREIAHPKADVLGPLGAHEAERELL